MESESYDILSMESLNGKAVKGGMYETNGGSESLGCGEDMDTL